jgi:preprotein translocase subunit SecY
VLTRLTFPGSLYLELIAIIPFAALSFINATAQFPFGGTASRS